MLEIELYLIKTIIFNQIKMNLKFIVIWLHDELQILWNKNEVLLAEKICQWMIILIEQMIF